jgi:glucan phosphoethanolaminetransferase (alkaline phosphatase superfamily)
VEIGRRTGEGRAGPTPSGPRTRRPAQGPVVLASVAALLVVLIAVSAAAGMQWTYPSARTTVAVMALAVASTALGWRLLPRRWRPRGAVPFVLACVGAYGVVQFGRSTDASGFLDHSVLTPLEGEVDEVSTWIFGILGALGLAAVLGVISWWTARRSVAGRER